MLKKYFQHNFYVLLLVLGVWLLSIYTNSLLSKITIMGVGLLGFIIINLLYHKKHTKINTGIVLEYIMLAIFVFLVYLIFLLF